MRSQHEEYQKKIGQAENGYKVCVCVRAGAVLVRACECRVGACMRVCKLCTIRQGILTKGKGDESHFISFHGLNVDKSQEMINLNLYF